MFSLFLFINFGKFLPHFYSFNELACDFTYSLYCLFFVLIRDRNYLLVKGTVDQEVLILINNYTLNERSICFTKSLDQK